MFLRLVLCVCATLSAVCMLTGCGGAAPVANSSALMITTTNIPAGTADALYSFTFAAQGGVSPYAWQLASGTLPAGLQLNKTSGTLLGTPTRAGQQVINVKVSDAKQDAYSRTFTLAISGRPMSTGLNITSTSAPGGTAGVAYNFTLTAQGGIAPYLWSITSGALPAGLQLNPTAGVLSGTPTGPGSQTVGIQVQDAAQNSATTTLTVSIATSASSPLSIVTSAIPTGTTGAGYSFTLAAHGGTPPYTWSITSGSLPVGLLLDSSTGAITGTPTQVANQVVDLQVRDSAKATASQSFTMAVSSNTSSYISYYVDSAAGNDSNSGTSTTSPWRTIAKVNATNFAAGDHILFKKGDTWRELLSLSSSGEAGNPIVIDAYGSGSSPIFSGSNLLPQADWTLCSGCQSGVWRASVSTQPNIVTFNGLGGNHKTSIAALAAPGDWYWSSNILYVWCSLNPGSYYLTPGVEAGERSLVVDLSALAYVTLQNLKLTGANGVPTNGVVYAHVHNGIRPHDLVLNNLALANGAGHGVHLEDCNNCFVQGLNVSGMASDGISLVSLDTTYPITSGAIVGNTVTGSRHDGIATYGCAIGGNCQGFTFRSGIFLSGIIISGNTVHDNGEGIYLEWTNHSSVSSNTVYHNTDTTVSSAEGGGIELEASSNNAIQKNLVYSNRVNGIELSNDAGAGTTLTGASYNTIEYNAVYGNGGHGLFTDAAPTQSNEFLYNLVWNQIDGECFLANGTGHGFYGNVCWHNSTGIDLYTSSSTPLTANITIKNNIIADSITRAVHIESGVSTSTLVFDHNDYDFGSGGEFLLSSTAYTFAGWKSGTGLDTHSFVANPEFVSSTPSAPADFVLQSTSPDIGAGAELSSAFDLGLAPASAWSSHVVTQTQPTAWDIGAFIVP